MTISTPDSATANLAERFHLVRDLTEALAAPLSAEDQVVQSMPDVSPTKWHRAHTTWFFETFVLQPHASGYEPVDAHYGYLFNSYYETVGERHPRPHRGMLTRPSCAEIAGYRRRVDDAMADLLRCLDPDAGDQARLFELIELGLHHEQQHQELLLMDIKHVLSTNPLRPAYRDASTVPHPDGLGGGVGSAGWIDVGGGITRVGHDGDGFGFDNEGPAHDVLLRDFRLADRLVTCGEWMDFMADGGYVTPTLWLSDGWHTVQSCGWKAPGYWHRDDAGWRVHTLAGDRPVRSSEPVVHVSYYEADAFARWAGARLPTEFEWEAAVGDRGVEGNLLASSPEEAPLHPVAAPPSSGVFRQLFGDVWEWTSSAYAPYPGFRAAPGAVGEYNGKFMVDQQVLRGGAAVTPTGHVRATYRNFFPAGARWMFGGVRLAGAQ